MSIWLIAFASLLILVGLVKSAWSAFELMPGEMKPEKEREKEDASMAGKVIYVILFVLGLFTLFHGLAILHLTPDWTHRMFRRPETHVVVNLVFGIVCLVFFSLALRPEPPTWLSTDKSKVPGYEIFGIGGGLIFLASIPVVLIVDRIFVKGAPWLHPYHAIAIIAFMALSAAAILLFVATLIAEKARKDECGGDARLSWSSILDVMTMVPANVTML